MSDENTHEYCDDELLSAHVDGELTDAERAVVDVRLRDDPQARELVADLCAVSQALRSLPKHELVADLREAVLQQALVHTDLAPAEDVGMRRWAWALLALAAALLLMAYLPEANRDEQPLAQAALEERRVKLAGSQLPVFDKRETAVLDLLIERTINAITNADTGSQGTAFDGTLRIAPIESAYLQPIGELRAEDYHIHLTPIDRSVGMARFGQLLANHGIAVRGQSSDSAATETELVLVEAPLEQLQRIVASCSGDDSPWKSLRLVDRDGSDTSPLHFMSQKPKLGTLAEEDFTAVLDGFQLSGAPVGGWAMHLGQVQFASEDLDSTESVSSSKSDVAMLRVLFVLHPASE